jgi:hypothetical protein
VDGMGGLNGGGALIPGGHGSISLESPMESPNGPRPTGAMRVRSLSLKKRSKRAAAGGLAGGQEESMFPPPPRPMHGGGHSGGPRDPLSQSAPSPLGGPWMQSSSPTRPPRRMMRSPSSRGSPMRGSPMRGSPMRGSPIRGGGPLLEGERGGGGPVGMLSGKATPSEMIHYVQRMATEMERMQRRIIWHETQRGGQDHSRRSDLSASMPLRMSPGRGGGGGGVPFAGAGPALVPPLNGAFGSGAMPPGGFSSAPPTHVNEWIRSPPTMGHRSPASATQRSSPTAAAKAKGGGHRGSGGGSEAAEAHRFREEMALLYPPLSAVLPPRRRRAGGASGLRDNVPSLGSAEGYAAHMATRVQSWARGRAVRRFMDQYRAQAEAATYVQAAWRGHLTRCGDEGEGDGRGGGGRGERGGGGGVERAARDGRGGGRSPRSPREGGGGGRGRDRELRRLQKQVDFLEENSEAQVKEGGGAGRD